jgi:hypothetical protein
MLKVLILLIKMALKTFEMAEVLDFTMISEVIETN